MKSIFKAWFVFLFVLFLGMLLVAAALHKWLAIPIFLGITIALGVVLWSIWND